MTAADLAALARAATPGPWRWQGEDYRGGWGWQLLVDSEGRGLICGESPDGPYKHLRALVPIDARYCKTGMLADDESAPCVHVQERDAAHIAAWSPERALAALAVVAEARTTPREDRDLIAALAAWDRLNAKGGA